MRKLLLTILLTSTWAVGQTSQASPGQMAKGSAQQLSISGCLSGSNGNYTLIDKTGNTYQLTGISADLSSHVGQQVRISGSAIPSPAVTSDTTETAATAPTRSSSSVAQVNKITVESVSKLSDHCSPGR